MTRATISTANSAVIRQRNLYRHGTVKPEAIPVSADQFNALCDVVAWAGAAWTALQNCTLAAGSPFMSPTTRLQDIKSIVSLAMNDSGDFPPAGPLTCPRCGSDPAPFLP